jgi:glycosyltransferase involved in cell wall biosynthesis
LAILSFWLSLTFFLVWRRRFIDIVHAHGTLQHGIAAIVGHLLGKKTILKVAMSKSDLAFERQGRLWGRLNRFQVKRFDRFIATSDDIYKECLALGFDPERIRRIPNGVDTSSFRPASSIGEKVQLRRSRGLPDGPIVCFVGVVDARKNVDGILRVWASVRKNRAPGHLVLVGPLSTEPDGEPSQYVKDLVSFVEREQLTASVTFAGLQTNVAEYLRSADIFLFPSRREGMPNVVLEAMASGLPCIASRIGGAADLVRHGETGFLFDVDDEPGFTQALLELLNDAGRTAQMGDAARRFIVERFALNSVASVYSALYTELLAPEPDQVSQR